MLLHHLHEKLINRVTVKSILCLTDSHQHSLALISALVAHTGHRLACDLIEVCVSHM